MMTPESNSVKKKRNRNLVFSADGLNLKEFVMTSRAAKLHCSAMKAWVIKSKHRNKKLKKRKYKKKKFKTELS